MNNTKLLIVTAIVAVFIAACGLPAGNAPANNANSNTANAVLGAPLAEALLVREREANEAYFKGDAKFFEDMLSDNFVMLGPRGLRMDKAAAVKMIAGNKCDIKDGWKLDEGHVSTVDRDTFVLTYKGTLDGTCTVNGKTDRAPSPIRAATVWVRSGPEYKPAFHGENLIVDPTAAAATPARSVASKDESKIKARVTTLDGKPLNEDGTPYKDRTTEVDKNIPAEDPNTDALVKAELAVWEAWKSHDAKKLEELTANDLSFVDIFGTVTTNKPDTIKLWVENRCEVKGVSVTDGVATPISPTVSILTFKGNADGTCYGQKIGGPIFDTSVYVKNGETWKSAFTLNSPD